MLNTVYDDLRVHLAIQLLGESFFDRVTTIFGVENALLHANSIIGEDSRCYPIKIRFSSLSEKPNINPDPLTEFESPSPTYPKILH